MTPTSRAPATLPAAAATLRRCLYQDGTRDLPRADGLLPAIGVLETFSAPSLLGAADTAVKTGDTTLHEVHLLTGIGGKATAVLYGDVESVRVAVEAGAGYARQEDRLAHQVVIPRPDPAILPCLGLGGPRSSE